MAVTKQTYTATATWTASVLADRFRSAFIDAGLMTDWFDSFTNTVENRVLRVINDGSKTYGTVYYWFMFTTTGVFINTTLTWNATTHVPTGTQFIDYVSTTTNATTNHFTIISLVATTDCTITRYTSGINSSVSWFLVRQGSSSVPFMLSHPSFNASSFVDQNKLAFNNFLTASSSTASFATQLRFFQRIHLRATYLGGMNLRGVTAASSFAGSLQVQQYLAPGNSSNNATANIGGSFGNEYSMGMLPIVDNNTNTTLASDHIPVFTAPTVSPYMAPLPADFGVAAYYASNTMVTQDTLVVTAGTEEWEMLVAGTNANTDAGRILFLARTV